MFNLGFFGGLGAPELILIGILVLIIFGPSRLPQLGRSIGKGLGEFKKGLQNTKDELEDITDTVEKTEDEKDSQS